MRFRHGLFVDETSNQCHWHLPEAYYLEAWSDLRAYDGTVSIVQPLIEPRYQGRSAHEVLFMLAGEHEMAGREIVRGYWKKQWEGREEKGFFEHFWQQALHDGMIPGTAFPSRTVKLQDGWEKALEPAGTTPRQSVSAQAGAEG